VTQYAIATPKGKPAAAEFVTKFVEESKQDGAVRDAIASAGLRRTEVAPAAVAQAADTSVVTTKRRMKIRVSQGVMEANVLHKVQPDYPAEAKANHIQGDVIFVANIDEQGNIAELKIVSGPPELAQAATEAVRQWKYKPFTIDGEPVEVETVIKIRFQM